MLDAKDVPNWQNRNSSGMYRWWEEMAEMGLAFHPDDPPHTIIDKNHLPCFSPAACLKLEKIFSNMYEAHGEAIYGAGQSALMSRLGWKENVAGDGWAPVTSDSSR